MGFYEDCGKTIIESFMMNSHTLVNLSTKSPTTVSYCWKCVFATVWG